MDSALDTAERRAQLRAAFASHAQRCPAQAELVDEYVDLLADPLAFSRERLAGHFTGSAWLVSQDGQRVLLTHHRKLQRWLQIRLVFSQGPLHSGDGCRKLMTRKLRLLGRKLPGIRNGVLPG